MKEINFEEILDRAFEKNLKRSIYELKDSKTVTLEAMKEVWNKAIEAAADNAGVSCDGISYGKIYTIVADNTYYSDTEISVNKNSILKLKV